MANSKKNGTIDFTQGGKKTLKSYLQDDQKEAAKRVQALINKAPADSGDAESAPTGRRVNTTVTKTDSTGRTQTWRSSNIGHRRSGQSRDQYDASVRENYANRGKPKTKQYYTYEPGKPGEAITAANMAAQDYVDRVQNLESAYNYAEQTKEIAQSTENYVKYLEKKYQEDPTPETLREYEMAVQRVGKNWDAHNQAIEAYNQSLGFAKQAEADYNTAMGDYEAGQARETQRFEEWKGTIRDQDTIQRDIDQTDAAIAELEKKKQPFFYMQGGYTAAEAEAMRAQNDEEIAQLEEQKKLLKEEQGWAEYFAYDEMRTRPDFAEKSKYVPTGDGKAEFNMWSGTFQGGFDDQIYDYINRNEEARALQMNQDISSGASFLGYDQSQLEQMTDDEIAMFNYLYATEGKDAAYRYIDVLTKGTIPATEGSLNARRRQQQTEHWADYANQHPVKSSIFSVLSSPLRGLDYISQAVDYLGDGELTKDAGYNKHSYMTTAIRDEVSGQIEKSGKWGKVGSFAYQTGMSMADFLFNTAISGGNANMAMAIMGTGAAADTTIEALDRGLSSDQAFALGTIAGLAEAVTERYSLETLLNGKWTKSSIGYVLKNVFAEGSEEGASDLINLFADILISGEKSQWQQSIDAYKAQGYSEKEAFWRAVRDQAASIGLDMLGGGISGGIMSGARVAYGQIAYHKPGAQVHSAGDSAIREVINLGLETKEGSEIYQLAQRLQQRLDSGKSISNADLGRLATAVRFDIGALVEEQQNEGQEETGTPEAVLPAEDGGPQIQEREPGLLPTAEEAERSNQHAEEERTRDDLPDESEEWDDGARAGEPDGELEESAEYREQDTEQGRKAAEIRATVEDLQRPKQTSRELGFRQGTDEATVTIVPDEMYTDEMRRTAERVQNETGREVVYFVGDLQIQDGNPSNRRGYKVANGAIMGGRIYIRADDGVLTIDQIADHEQMHAEIDRLRQNGSGQAEDFLEMLRAEIESRYTHEEFQNIIDEYIINLRGIEGANSLNYILEELICDAHAGINAFGAHAERYQQTVREATQQHRQQDAAGKAEARAPPKRFGKNAAEQVRTSESARSELKALSEALSRGEISDEDFDAAYEAMMEEPEMQDTARFSISENLEEDLEAVLDGTFPAARGEVYIGETSNFLTDEIGADALTVTMPAGKAYSAMVSEARAKADGRYRAGANYHGLGLNGLMQTLEASENPVAAFADTGDEKGKRTGRIVLVTDEVGPKGNIAVVEAVNVRARLNNNKIEANKVITAFDRARIASDIIKAAADGRLLHLDKKRSQQMLAGRPGANSLAAIRDADFKSNIQDFWAEVKREQDGAEPAGAGDGENHSFARAYEEAQRKQDTARFSISENESDIEEQDRRRIEKQMQRYQDGEISLAELRGYINATADMLDSEPEASYNNRTEMQTDSEGRELNPEEARHLQGTAVVDEEGRPLVVYHSTPDMEFEDFAKGDIGFHFGTQEQAWQRGKDKGEKRGRMFRVYLNIQNPLNIEKDYMNWHANATAIQLWNDGIIDKETYLEIETLWEQGAEYDAPAAVRLREILADMGYDGITYVNDYEGKGKSYIAFESDQVVTSDIDEWGENNERRETDRGRDWRIQENMSGERSAGDIPKSGRTEEGIEGESNAGNQRAREGREDDAGNRRDVSGGENRTGLAESDITEWRENDGGGENRNHRVWRRDAENVHKGQAGNDVTEYSQSQGLYGRKNQEERLLAGDEGAVVTTAREDIHREGIGGLAVPEARLPGGEEDARFSISEAAPDEAPEAVLPGGEKTDITAAMPAKAQKYLGRVERAMIKGIGNALGIPRLAGRQFMNGIVREISNEYLQTGTVRQELLDELFERAYEQGIVVDDEFYNQYKDLKNHLKKQKITISDDIKNGITDFESFRRSAAGALRLVNDGGLAADMVYQELSEMAPELFPTDITHPADQVMRMFEVARSLQRTEKSLGEYRGELADEYRKWAKNDFDAAVAEYLGELQQAKRYLDERAEDARAKAEKIATQEEVAKAYAQLKDARKAVAKAVAKNLLTSHDETQVARLLRGELELENLDPRRDNVKGITAVFEAKREYERIAKRIREYNQKRKASLRAEADGYLKTANNWKDKKMGIQYARETMERNVMDIVPDKQLAKEINRKYFKPVHEAAAAANKLKNRYRQRVQELNLSRKVAKGNLVSESHAVQLLGEAQDNIRMLEQARGRIKQRDGKTLGEWHDAVNALWKENPKLDRAKIENAVKEFRTIYNELFQKMNDVRVRNGYEPINYRSGYFPHFQPGDGDGIMAAFGKAIGMDTAVTALPTSINGLTHMFRPGIQWFGNAQERLGFNTAYDAVEGFDRYIEGIADVICQTDNIQRLRAFASQIRYRTTDDGIREQVDAVRNNPELADADKENQIEKIYENGRFALSNFAVEMDEYTNLLANKKSRADRNMEQAIGRKAYNIVKGLESRVAANMVAVNPASWLTNFIPLTQGGAQLDRWTLLKGMWNTLKAYKTADGMVEQSTFLTNRRGSDPLVRTWQQKASAKLSSPMEWIDQFTAGSLVRGRYEQNVKHGMSETAAMEEADAWVAGVMADRSKGSMPTLFYRTNPLTKVFTQFQLEVNNQLSYLFKDMPREQRDKGMAALALALLKFCLGAWLYDEIYEYFIGRRPALDPIGILNDTAGDLTGYELPNMVELVKGIFTGDMPSIETERKGIYDTLSGLGENVAEELPFIGGVLGGGRVPIGSAIPDVANLGKAMFSGDWDGRKRWNTAKNELTKPLTYLALPFGGGQIKKIAQGVEATARGGSYTVDTDGNDILQYPVFTDNPMETALNMTRMLLFGKTSLPTAQEWVESGFKSMGAKETEAYQKMVGAGVPGKDAFALLEQMGDVEKTDEESANEQKLAILRDSDINGEGKSEVYYQLLASDKEQELMDKLALTGSDMGEVTMALIGIKEANKMKGAARSNAQRDAIVAADLPDIDKIQIYRDRISDTRDEDIEAFDEAGLDFDQFLEAQNAYATYNEEYDNAGEKATAFSRWVNEQGYTDQQAAVVRDSFRYYTQIPVDAGSYDKFVDAGISDDKAFALAGALSGLEPEEGQDKVTAQQKWQTVIDAGLGEKEELAALKTVMSDSEYTKLNIGYTFGVPAATYVTLKGTLPKYDADGNGALKNAEIEAAIDALRLTNTKKAVLWQLMTGSKSAKNNPYDVNVGQRVVAARQSASEKSKSEKEKEKNGNNLFGIMLPS